MLLGLTEAEALTGVSRSQLLRLAKRGDLEGLASNASGKWVFQSVGLRERCAKHSRQRIDSFHGKERPQEPSLKQQQIAALDATIQYLAGPRVEALVAGGCDLEVAREQLGQYTTELLPEVAAFAIDVLGHGSDE